MKRTVRVYCKHEGCRESTRFPRRQKWTCTRHSEPDEVLMPDRTVIEFEKTMENRKVMHKPDQVLGLFWDDKQGFVFGDGWKAWSKDFPEGAKLTVKVRVSVEVPVKLE